VGKFRCLNGVQDELHDYAEAINARLAEHLEANPVAIADFGNFEGIVLHRAGQLQAELITILPSAKLPNHVHPHVDSVELLVEGNIRFNVDRLHITRLIKNAGLRIPAKVPHGGTADPSGVAFVSCQRWAVEPSHVGLDWLGVPATLAHAQMLDALQAVR
jgi:quercetin dioxygenase-like cupin family protein